MVRFCGQERCLIDANGRVRLPPRLAAAFQPTGPDVMLHVLPEGALGVFPVPAWDTIGTLDDATVRRTLTDVRTRRTLRRLGAWSSPEVLSNQGRLTIPHAFREVLGLVPGAEVVVTGCGIGVEIWAAPRWETEMGLLADHELRRNDALMAADLRTTNDGGGPA